MWLTEGRLRLGQLNLGAGSSKLNTSTVPPGNREPPGNKTFKCKIIRQLNQEAYRNNQCWKHFEKTTKTKEKEGGTRRKRRRKGRNLRRVVTPKMGKGHQSQPQRAGTILMGNPLRFTLRRLFIYSRLEPLIFGSLCVNGYRCNGSFSV